MYREVFCHVVLGHKIEDLIVTSPIFRTSGFLGPIDSTFTRNDEVWTLHVEHANMVEPRHEHGT